MRKTRFYVSLMALILMVYCGAHSFGQKKQQCSQPAPEPAPAAAPEPVAVGDIQAVAPVAIKTSEMSLNVSDDRLAATVNFNGVEANVAGEADDTPINSAFLEVALSKPDGDGHRQLIGYTVDIKGNFDLDPTARGSVTLVFDGQAEAIEFPYPSTASLDLHDTDDGDDADSGHRSGDFDKRFFFLSHVARNETPVTSPLRVQVIVQVTGSSEDHARLVVDDITFEARTSPG